MIVLIKSRDRRGGGALRTNAERSEVCIGENDRLNVRRSRNDGGDYASLPSFSQIVTTDLADGIEIMRPAVDSLVQAVIEIQFPSVQGGTTTGVVVVRRIAIVGMRVRKHAMDRRGIST